LLAAPSIKGAPPEITAHERGRLADKRFGQILLVGSDPGKLDAGVSVLQASGVEVTESERIILQREPSVIFGRRLAILSRPVS
jgi:hypothetical protein